MDKQVKERVVMVLQKVTGQELPALNFNANLSSQVELDSVQIVEFFAALEMEFEIELPLLMMQAQTADEFLSILEGELLQACA
ncbi:MAG: acyl carrier protein [Bacteroidales bacterium]|nr:acyl carrier protein [Bacteroidales bacterium]